MSSEQPEQSEPVDVRNNRESRAASADTLSRVARASDGGAPPREAPAAGHLPEDVPGGTAEGNPVAGVTITTDGLEAAVPGDTGPNELDGQTAGHA